ncbi:dihydrofolate reductase [Nocardiopsis mwathae]|uniref:Dihydrofolate reductase n=1 Tax=Nocardiopsis mwathae TaxID=1472723 RepID=A0A7W9YMB8_9ACTN|nr:dihydrofolate reductase family protein [Nocardiopsis mwathae]MBB6174807.1 dihydrofolate reductase [Nocardiopsis mwathae]
MRKLTYYIAMSIDGCIEGPGGEVDFYPLGEEFAAHMSAEYPECLPTHVRERFGIDVPNRRFDTVIQGRTSYQIALREGITSPYAHTRQYVASTSMAESPDPAVRIVADPLETVRGLKRENGDLGIYLVGGAKLAGALLPEIDELVIKRYPVVAGAGTPMFTGARFDPAEFALTDRRVFGNGTECSTYTRA